MAWRREEEMKVLFTEHLAHWVLSGPARLYTRKNKVSRMVLVIVTAEVEEGGPLQLNLALGKPGSTTSLPLTPSI